MRNCLNGRLIKTVDKIKSSFKTCFSSNLSKFSDESSKKIKNFTTKTEISKSKETFDSLVTCLRADRISSYVENQQTQLGNMITDLDCEDFTAENKANFINKRIEQLKESFDDDFNKELFYCEVSEWNRILEQIEDLSISNIFSIKCCYEKILEVLKKADGIKYKIEKQIQVKSVEIDELLGRINSLLFLLKILRIYPFF